MNALLSTLADDRFVLWAFNALIHATLISIVVLLVAAMFRRQAAIRYWLLCLGLLLILLSPATSAMIQLTGQGWLSLPVTTPERHVAAPSSHPIAFSQRDRFKNAAESFADSPETMQSLSPTQPTMLDGSRGARLPSPIGAGSISESISTPNAASNSDAPMASSRLLVLTVTFVWALVGLIMLARMLVGWTRMARILEAAKPVYSESITRVLEHACRTVSWDRTARPRPQLVVSSAVSGPIAAGVFHGKIVLPPSLLSQVETEELSDVIIHEVAHLYRRDQIVVLFQNLVAAMFWPHPLVRWLNCELAKAREEVCDNFVMSATDAPHYSRTLLALAELILRPTNMPGSVGFFTSKWKLEQRIAGILDAGRDRSTLLSRKGSMLVVLTASLIIALICVGTITVSTAADEQLSERGMTAANDLDQSRIVSGIVKGPDGSPVANASVVVLRGFRANVSWQTTFDQLATVRTDEHGLFEISIDSKSDRFSNGKYLEQQETIVLAHKAPYGPDQSVVTSRGGRQELHLTSATEPIRGRILDLEGQPIEGVQVRLQQIDKPGSSVDQWLELAKNNPATLARDSMMNAFGGGSPAQAVNYYPEATRMDSITVLNVTTQTDQDGRFQMDGIGDDQRAILRIDGPTISSTLMGVVARDMEPVNTPSFDPRERTGKTFGNDFVVSIEPAQIIRGQIRDKKTGEPLPGVLVDLNNYPDDVMALDMFIATRTDANGHYELGGVPKQAAGLNRPMELFVEPAEGQPYFRSSHRVPSKPGLEPIDFDIELTPAIWAEGRVTEEGSGNPVRSLVAYHPYLDNSHADQHESFVPGMHSMGYEEMFATDADGRFQIPALPGRGVLRVVAEHDFQYELMPIPGASLSKASGEGRKYKLYHVLMPGNAVVELDVDEGETTVVANPTLRPLKRIQMHVTAPDGSDTTDFYVAGQYPHDRPTATGRGTRYWNSEPSETSIVEIFIDNDAPEDRPIMLLDSENKTGIVTSIGELQSRLHEGQVDVQLQPCARIHGRLVDAQGVTVSSGWITSGVGKIGTINGMFPTKEGMQTVRSKHLPFQSRGVSRLDADGRFEAWLPPGTAPWTAFLNGQPEEPVIMQATELLPGEEVDLGTIDISGDERPDPIRSTNDERSVSQTQDQHLRLRGIVRGPDGGPISAQVWIAGPARSGNWSRTVPKVEWTMVATSDREGRFAFAIPPSSLGSTTSAQPAFIRVAATLSELGFAWADVQIDQANQPVTLQLVQDVEIRGRFVTTEGSPIAGVELTIADIRAPESIPDSVKLVNDAAFVSGIYTNWPAWFGGPPNGKAIVTDTDGQFRMTGLGAERYVRLQARMGGIGATRLSVVTRQPPTDRPGGMIATRKGLAESQYFADFTHVAVPGRDIQGVVVDRESNEPIENAHVVAMSSWESRGAPSTTDANGEFAIAGVPQDVKYELELTPDDGDDHFRKRFTIDDTGSTAVVKTSIELARGIVIRGKIVDKQTGKGVAASVEYNAIFPNANVDELAEGRMANPLSTGTSDSDGNFAITVLPGYGAIGIRAGNDRFTSASVDAKEIERLFQGESVKPRPEPSGHYSHLETAAGGNSRGIMGVEIYQAIKLLKVDNDSPPRELQFELKPVSKRSGEIVDADGLPVTGVEVIGLGSNWTSRTREPLPSHKFDVLGLMPGVSRTLVFLQRERSLGAAITVTGDEQSHIKVTLRPTGEIRGRLVDSLGEPLAGARLEELMPILNGAHLSGTGFWVPEVADDGLFAFEHLIGGVVYSLHAMTPEAPYSLPVDGKIQLEAGQVKDLGTFQLTEKNRFKALPKSGNE